jgi:hypothetical protein
LTMFWLSLAGVVAALLAFAELDVLVLPVLPLLVLAAVQPAITSRTNARNAANLIFMRIVSYKTDFCGMLLNVAETRAGAFSAREEKH